MELIYNPDRTFWPKIIQRPVYDYETIGEKVIPIIDDVKSRGDAALKHYTKIFDGASLNDLHVEPQKSGQAAKRIDADLKAAILIAKKNIEKFHRSQLKEVRKIEIQPGVTCWQRSVPIERVGLYIPGGSAPLFSSVLMLGIPAVIAGCTQIILCTPPDKNAEIHPAILYSAALLGITDIFKAGGAQAIAAMAYGTETIPKVDKIFGPGNQYVTAAKQRVSLEGTAIDMPAGPSEVAIIADHTANPRFIAADLLSQAEHGPDSQVFLVTNDENLLKTVGKALEEQLDQLPRKEFARQSLENSKMILIDNLKDGMALINAYAPEHLILMLKAPDTWAEKVVNAGSVFLGDYTPEAAGDYASGTNHTLPTSAFARMYSGVTTSSFMKEITFQKLTRPGLKALAGTIEGMAEAEGLDAHTRAVSIRLEGDGDGSE